MERVWNGAFVERCHENYQRIDALNARPEWFGCCAKCGNLLWHNVRQQVYFEHQTSLTVLDSSTWSIGDRVLCYHQQFLLYLRVFTCGKWQFLNVMCVTILHTYTHLITEVLNPTVEISSYTLFLYASVYVLCMLCVCYVSALWVFFTNLSNG